MEKERELVRREDKTGRRMKEKKRELVTRGKTEAEREGESERQIPGNLAALPKLNN